VNDTDNINSLSIGFVEGKAALRIGFGPSLFLFLRSITQFEQDHVISGCGLAGGLVLDFAGDGVGRGSRTAEAAND
jgi:hypothetical protein